MKTKKLIVLTLLALLLVPTMACGGAGEQEPTPGVTPTPGMTPTPTVTLTPTPTPTKHSELTVDNIRLCSDVRDANDYDLNSNATYARGQAVFVLFDVYGVTSTKNDGQYDIHLRVEKLAVFGPEGQEVATLRDVADVRETSPTLAASVAAWAFFGAALAGPLGEYSVEITVEDVPSGDTTIAKASFVVEDSPLAIRHLRLCSEVRDFRDYTLQPNGVYDLGDMVWVYFEVHGVSVGGAERQQELWLKVSQLNLYDPQDRLVMRVADVLSERLPYDGSAAPYLSLWLDVGEGALGGRYAVEFTLEDGLTGEAVVDTFNFTME